MKVNIRNHSRRVSAYSFLEPLEKWLGERRVDRAYDVIQPVLNSTVNRVLDRGRKIKVVVHDYDIWNADNTLAHIIVPVLQKLKQNKHGTPHIDDEDVPEELRSTAFPLSEADKDMGKTDENWQARWDWVLDEMIWSFQQVIDESWEDQFFSEEGFDKEGHKVYSDRIMRGHMLFGKYFRALWD